jgi:hypothetical protein
VPTREDELRDHTFKGDVTELDKRIYYTLTTKPGAGRDSELSLDLRSHRTAKLVSQLVVKLHEQGILDDNEIDEMLLNLLG